MPERPSPRAAGQAGPDRVPGVGSYSWHVLEDRLDWSPALAAIYGTDHPPADERGFFAFVHPEDRQQVEAETLAFLGAGSAYEHEFRILRPDGEVRVVSDRGVIERAADGSAVALHGLNVDITRHRSGDGSEEELPRFRTLVDNIDQLAWMADGAGYISWYNRRWYDYTGSTAEAMRGWGWTAVHHPDHVDRVVATVRAAFESGEPWEDTFPLRRHDGVYRWFLSRAQPIRGADGRITHWFGTNTDVTEARDVEDRLKRSEERFRLMADSMPQLVWVAEPAGEVSYYNRQVTNFGSVRDPDSGRFDWTRLVHEEDLPATRERWAAAAETLGEFSCEHRLLMADGSWRWHLSRAIPVADGLPGSATWYGTATDIHELKRLQDHRLLLSQELDHRMRNTLALVQSIANQTFRTAGGDMEAVATFNARLRALAKANDIIVHSEWSETEVGEICRHTLGALGIEDRVAMSGPPLRVPPRIGFILSLGLHELGTNAMKHGSLTRPDGRVSLGWARAEDGGFRMTWEESNGPPVVAPESEGFGSRLLKSALSAEIGGHVDIRYAATGVRCEVAGRLD